MTQTYNALRTFDSSSYEYRQLISAAAELNKRLHKLHFSVENTWFDRGQNWEYTTLIVQSLSTKNQWQALTPVQQKIAVYGDDDEISKLIETLVNKYENEP
ncbi:hypothetical protein J6A31_06630 [bacterium]|nr:hypothetical protein [bacterium]